MKTIISVNKPTITSRYQLTDTTLQVGELLYSADLVVTHPIDLTRRMDKATRTVIAYGLTGSGKTLLIRTLLDHIKYKYPLKVWAIEIMNEKAYDLLSSQRVTIGIMGCRGQSIRELSSRKDLDSYLDEVKRNRTTLATRYNAESSRSHLILQLGNYRLYDLAGSESAVNGESGYINSSLLALNRVITSLAKKASHIPYRDSLLTISMKGLLELKTTLLCCCVRCDSDLSETIQSLNHMMTARKIVEVVTHAKPKLSRIDSADISELEDELDKYRDMYGSLLSWVSKTVTRLPPPHLPPPPQ